MFSNPFTPIFGGKPDLFFGRKNVLSRFDRALEVRGSEYRTLFLTGTRGSGKTALVEQLSARASAAGWEIIDLTADNALQSFFRQIQEFDELTSVSDPKLKVKVFGTGGSLSGLSTQKTPHYDADDVDILFRRMCEKAKKGCFVSIDEIQKVPLEDISKICGAFQMASRKGCDVILVAAGLPYSFEPVIQHDGCTFMRRSVHEELGLFTPAEAREAFEGAFSRIRGLSLDEQALDSLVSNSSGHPYMTQLLGYHLIEFLNGIKPNKGHVVKVADVERAVPVAMEAYERRALQPMLDSLSSAALSYLNAMVAVMGNDHVAATGDVAKKLGKTHQQLAKVRQSLLDEGIIITHSHGWVRFAIPYLRAYLGKTGFPNSQAALLEEWDV